MNNLLEWLQNIYFQDLCNGSWEHGHGFSITNIDNPGWVFKFELSNSFLEGFGFNQVKVDNNKNDWYRCQIQNGIFEGVGGPQNLINILQIFQEWYLNAQMIYENKKDPKTEHKKQTGVTVWVLKCFIVFPF